MIESWLHALHGWEAAEFVRRSFYAYPLLNAAHIFSLTLLVGGILPADLRMLGLFQGVAAGPFLQLATTMSAIGLALAAATGFMLFTVQPLEYASNPAFLTKISLVAVGTANALVIRLSGAWRLALATGEATPGLKLGAAISIAIWTSALIAGRWIAFL